MAHWSVYIHAVTRSNRPFDSSVKYVVWFACEVKSLRSLAVLGLRCKHYSSRIALFLEFHYI